MAAPPSLKFHWRDVQSIPERNFETKISIRRGDTIRAAEDVWLTGMRPVLINLPSEHARLQRLTAINSTLDGELLPIQPDEVVYSPAVPVTGAEELWLDIITCPVDDSAKCLRNAFFTAAKMGNTAIVLPYINRSIERELMRFNGVFAWIMFAIEDNDKYLATRRYLEAAAGGPATNDRHPNQ